MKKDISKFHKGCQAIYDKNGKVAFDAEWDSKVQFETASKGISNGDWSGKKVLVMASNTSGLCLELARAGAHVISCEPDPYKNTRAVAKKLLDKFVKDENLSIEFLNLDFFNTHKLAGEPGDQKKLSKILNFFKTNKVAEKSPKLDDETIIICFGIIYHFRDIIYALEYLGSLPHCRLLISTQTHPTDRQAIFNRIDPKIIPSPNFWDNHKDTISGWHFSRKLFTAYLESVGYVDIKPISPENFDFPVKPKGHTNSAYYCAKHIGRNDLKTRMEEYLPR